MLPTELLPLVKLELPYPGLRPFEADEAFLFYGRKTHTEEILQSLATNRFLAVVGTSGSGKSSLIRAGLVPALYRGYLAGSTSRWRIAVMKPGDAPMANLAKALETQNLPAAKLSRSSLGLVQAVPSGALASGEGLLLVVDQFEELFRFREEQTDGSEEAKLFVMSLLEAANSFSAPIYIVLTLRSEFLGECTQFPGLAEAMNRSQYLIPRLTREQRREAIEVPIRLVDAAMTARLVQRLLNESGDDPNQLPVLQHALNRTFRKWIESGGLGEIDFCHYEAAGTIQSALNDHADSLLADLPEAARPWVERLFRCLTTTRANGSAVRRPTRLDGIYKILAIDRNESLRVLIREVIATYAARDHSLLACSPSGPLTEDTVVDISHESLIASWTKLRAWVNQEAESVKWYASAAEDTQWYSRGEAGTWRDPELKRALEFATQGVWNAAWACRNVPEGSPLFEEVRAFLDRGASEQRAERRRARALWTGLGVLLVFAVIGLGAFAWERGRELQARGKVIEAQAREIELRRQISQQDDQAQAMQNEVALLNEQLKQSNLSRAQRVDIERTLEAKTAELAGIELARHELEKKVDAGTKQAQDSASAQNAAEARARKLEADLKTVVDERDAYKRQLNAEMTRGTKSDASGGKGPGSIPVKTEPTPAKSASEVSSPARSPGQTRIGKDGLTYVWIPPGEFTMGCPKCSDASPAHQVILTNGFWLGETEVTTAAYLRFRNPGPDAPSSTSSSAADLPQVNVTWEDAKAYCDWAGLRLPTEAEWEYSARAGTTGAMYGKLDEIAWYKDNSEKHLHPVRQKKPNPWGLYDMLGNALEWVADWHDLLYYEGLQRVSAKTTNPTGPRVAKNRVLRGGSWNSPNYGVSAWDRDRAGPMTQRNDISFRCAGEVPD